MTMSDREDAAKTHELITLVDRGASWLRHTGLAGELDWLLLRGATATELHEVRPSWGRHADHLRKVHGLVVQEEGTGFHRIVGAHPAEPLAEEAGSVRQDADDVGSDDVESDAADPSATALLPVRIEHSARALASLHTTEDFSELKNPLNKEAVTMFIRKASECDHWHNTTDYRSRAAADAIAAADITSVSQYQAFCRRNLCHEHMVPNNVIYRMIVSSPNPTADWIKRLFIQLSKRATITRQEDLQLRRFEMPPQFYEPGHAWYSNPLARYIESGLAESLQARRGPTWIQQHGSCS